MATPPSELIHALVLREMQDGIIRDGLWAKAVAESGADKAKAKAAADDQEPCSSNSSKRVAGMG